MRGGGKQQDLRRGELKQQALRLHRNESGKQQALRLHRNESGLSGHENAFNAFQARDRIGTRGQARGLQLGGLKVDLMPQNSQSPNWLQDYPYYY